MSSRHRVAVSPHLQAAEVERLSKALLDHRRATRLVSTNSLRGAVLVLGVIALGFGIAALFTYLTR